MTYIKGAWWLLGAAAVALGCSSNRDVRVTERPGKTKQAIVTPPELDRSVVTTTGSQTTFLYTGSTPTQSGVASGTIDVKRAAALSGKIIDRDTGAPIAGVTVKVLGMSEFGATQTENDGSYRFVVNGTRRITLDFSKNGYFVGQRRVQANALQYASVADLALVQKPSGSLVSRAIPMAAGTGEFSAAGKGRLYRGPQVTDAHGTRRLNAYFPPQVWAKTFLANGQALTLSTASVSSVEYTTGANGLKAMPADLPAASAYTYAAELTVAEGEGAVFNPPVPIYVDNFIALPIGTNVPSGYYDRAKGQWVAGNNGRVIKILSVTSGKTDLDVDGSNTAANATTLAGMGITDAERTELATLYAVGNAIWRVPVGHFSLWDFNLGYVPPTGAQPGSPGDDANDSPETCKVSGHSVIECESQVLAEALPVSGTPFELEYRSDRVVGRTDSFRLKIPVTGPTLPGALQSVQVELTVGGRTFTQTLPASTNQFFDFTWDGKDAFGRLLQGVQPALVRVGNVYNALYANSPRFGAPGGGSTGVPTRTQAALWGSRTYGLGVGREGRSARRLEPQCSPRLRSCGPGRSARRRYSASFQPTLASGYVYDADRALSTISTPDGLVLQNAYDTADRLQTVTLPTGTITYTYSAETVNISSLAGPYGETLTFGYDGQLMRSQTWAGPAAGSVKWTYDADFRISSEQVNSLTSTSFGYDHDSLLTSVGELTVTRSSTNGFVTGTTLSTINDSYAYDAFGALATYTARFNATVLYDQNVTTRDALARIKNVTETVQGTATALEYAYDTRARLTDVSRNGTNVAHYDYDANGNRTTGPIASLTAKYDAQDRLLTSGSRTYTYGANGELDTKVEAGQTTTYTYDVVGNLTNVALPGAVTIEYIADGQGRRVGKKKNGVLIQGFLFSDQLRIAAELNATNGVVSTFNYGTKANVPDFMKKGGVTYRIISDHLGSVRLVVNASTGAVAQRIDYDEFGVVTTDSSPGFQPFGFAGGLWDVDTQLVRFGARDYDPSIGRWLSKDPSGFNGNDSNLYRYGAGDPVNFFDLDGEMAFAIPGGAVGDIAGGAVLGAFAGAAIAGHYVGEQLGDQICRIGDGAGTPDRDRDDSTDTPRGPGPNSTDPCAQRCLPHLAKPFLGSNGHWYRNDDYQLNAFQRCVAECRNKTID